MIANTDAYERHKGAALERGRKTSAEARDIGSAPEVENPQRRVAALADPELFLKTYFGAAFPLEFSDDHRLIIQAIAEVATAGGQYALACQRGFGKTTITKGLAIWAILKGLRQFLCIICATDSAAKKLLKQIKDELCWNETLNADFPELWGIPQLQNDARKAGGQMCCGKKTQITWGVNMIVLPTREGSPIAGAIISTCGITGAIRGQNHRLMTGEIIRPDMAILDDPQTRESAKSSSQTTERVEIIEGDVMGLAGPTVTIACIMPCTVIYQGDLADEMLDSKKHPMWKASRLKMLRARPTNEKLWDTYFEIRAEGKRVDGDSLRGNAFYLANRAELDAGGEVSWRERFNPDEVSALQSAMNLWYRNPAAFAAEYQQEPINSDDDTETPSFKGIDSRLNGLPRLVCPVWSSKLVGFIDVQQRILYYLLLAVGDDFTASVIDYGFEPDQPRNYFTLREVKKTLATVLGEQGQSASIEACIELGLGRLITRLATTPYARQGGAEMRIDKLFVDSGKWSDTVHEAVRKSAFGATVQSSKGYGCTAAKRPMSDWPASETQKIGFHYIETRDPAKRAGTMCMYDTNFWKTFGANRAATLGTQQSLQLWGDKPEQHRMLKDHLAGEACVKTEGHGRTVWQWSEVPGEDNHLLDCLTGCYAAAARMGVRLPEHAPAAKRKKRTSSIPDHMRAGRAM